MWDAGDLHSVTSSAADVCLHLQQLPAMEYGQDESGLKSGGILPAWPLCWCYSPQPHLSLWVAAGCQTWMVLQDLGMAQATPDLSLLGCICSRPYTMVPGPLLFQGFLAQCSYCGVLCTWVGFF